VHLIAALLARPKPLEALQPGHRALHHPAVAAELLARLDTSSGDARRDVSAAKPAADVGEVVPLVPVGLQRPPTGSPARPPHGRAGIEEGEGLLAVMHVRGRQLRRHRLPVPVYDQMMLRARFAAARRVRAGAGPLSSAHAAGVEAGPARRGAGAGAPRARRPGASRSRRQQVTPLQPKTSAGRPRWAIPVVRTKRMPRRQARSSRYGRPPFGWAQRRGSSRATRAQRASGASSHAMPQPGSSRRPGATSAVLRHTAEAFRFPEALARFAAQPALHSRL
jgi:hypothetical protein